MRAVRKTCERGRRTGDCGDGRGGNKNGEVPQVDARRDHGAMEQLIWPVGPCLSFNQRDLALNAPNAQKEEGRRGRCRVEPMAHPVACAGDHLHPQAGNVGFSGVPEPVSPADRSHARAGSVRACASTGDVPWRWWVR